MLISVVIPTRNRADLLEGTLTTLAAQVSGPEDWEVLVMDNGSTDRTAAVCARMSNGFKKFRYELVKEPGLHAARNRGWLLAYGEIIAYLDDDVRLPRHWIAGVRNAFCEPTTMLAGGPVLPEFVGQPPAWLARLWYHQPKGCRILGDLSLVDLGDERKAISPFCVYGCNYLVKRSVLTESNGFHPDGMPNSLLYLRGDGETYVSQYVYDRRWKCIYEPLASVGHLVTAERMTMQYFMMRHFRQAISDSYANIRRGEANALFRVFLRTLRRCAKYNVRNWRSTVFCVAYLFGYLSHHVRAYFSSDLKKWIMQKCYIPKDVAK